MINALSCLFYFPFVLSIVDKRQDKKAQQVILRNNGTEIFKLKGITTSCECTTTKQEWTEIAPGEMATLTVYYKAEQPGDFYRTVTIYGNVPGKSLTLSLVGKVK